MGYTIHHDPDGGVHILLVFASGHGCGIYLDSGQALRWAERNAERRDGEKGEAE